MMKKLILAGVVVSGIFAVGCSSGSSSGNSSVNADGTCTQSTIDDTNALLSAASTAMSSSPSGETAAWKYDAAAKQCDTFVQNHPNAECKASLNGEEVQLHGSKVPEICAKLHKGADDAHASVAARTIPSASPSPTTVQSSDNNTSEPDYRRSSAVSDDTHVADLSAGDLKIKIRKAESFNRASSSNGLMVLSEGRIVALSANLKSFCLVYSKGDEVAVGNSFEIGSPISKTSDQGIVVTAFALSPELALICANSDNSPFTVGDLKKSLGTVATVQTK